MICGVSGECVSSQLPQRVQERPPPGRGQPLNEPKAKVTLPDRKLTNNAFLTNWSVPSASSFRDGASASLTHSGFTNVRVLQVLKGTALPNWADSIVQMVHCSFKYHGSLHSSSQTFFCDSAHRRHHAVTLYFTQSYCAIA